MDLQQTSPSPVCPGDDVIFTCAVTASTNQSSNLFLFLVNPLDDLDRVFYDAGVTMGNASSLTVGPFTTELVEVSHATIVTTATIEEITSEDITSAGIKCKDSSGNESVLYVNSSKRKHRGCVVINL